MNRESCEYKVGIKESRDVHHNPHHLPLSSAQLSLFYRYLYDLNQKFLLLFFRLQNITYF